MKHDFTRAQVGSMLMSAKMRDAARVELKKHEFKRLEFAVGSHTNEGTSVAYRVQARCRRVHAAAHAVLPHQD